MKITRDLVDIDLHGSRILVIDDEITIQHTFARVLKQQGYEVKCVGTGADAINLLKSETFNLLIVDKNLPDTSGLEIIYSAQELQPGVEVIIITGYASYESAIEALRLGVYDYLEKPFAKMGFVVEKIKRALQKQRLFFENRILADHLNKASRGLVAVRRNLLSTIDHIDKLGRADEHRRDVSGDLRRENAELRFAFETVHDKLIELQNQIFLITSGLSNVPPTLSEAGGQLGEARKAPVTPVDDKTVSKSG